MNYRRATLFACLTSACLVAAILLAGMAASSAMAAPVPDLSELRTAPTSLVYVKPGRTAAIPRCTVEAEPYRWNGSHRGIGRQHWNKFGDRIVWNVRSGRRITFDGINVHNGTRVPILFAGWCDDAF